MSVTYSYSGATYDVSSLSQELVAGGVTVVTVRGDTSAVDVVCADGTVQATVDAIVTAHSGSPTPPHKYPVLDGTSKYVRADGTLVDPLVAHVALTDPHTQYQRESQLDQANGYAGLNASSRTTKGVIAADDVIVDSDTKGLVLKSPNLHYWRATIDNAGSVTWTDLGTTPP